jgi:hypothetical protein
MATDLFDPSGVGPTLLRTVTNRWYRWRSTTG